MMFGARIGWLFFLAAGMGLIAPATSFGQPWAPGNGQPNPWQDPTERWASELAEARGWLIVDGQEIPLPCRIVLDGDELKINDHIVTSRLNLPQQAPSGQRGDGSRREAKRGESEVGRRPRAVTPPARFEAIGLGHAIVQNLVSGNVVIALAGQPLLVVADGKAQYDLLRTLGGDNRPRVAPASFNTYLPRGSDARSFDDWIASFEPSADFRQRALAKVDLYDETEAAAIADIAATRRLNTFSYPLSVLGMVVTTLGIGHLLTHRPPVDVKPLETDASPLALRVLNYSLILVIIYSAIDLTWTILAYQAGEMLELNPLGSQLIHDPLKLIAFKCAATGMGVGLLFFLRKYRKAQLAAWWICLICTLVTARWLTMSQMFAA